MSYIVVFENILENGHPGGRYTTTYQSETDFKSRDHSGHNIIKSGVTEREAIQICESTPTKQIVEELIQEASESGTINQDIMKLKFINYLLVATPIKKFTLAREMMSGEYPEEVLAAYFYATSHRL